MGLGINWKILKDFQKGVCKKMFLTRIEGKVESLGKLNWEGKCIVIMGVAANHRLSGYRETGKNLFFYFLTNDYILTDYVTNLVMEKNGES